MDPYLNYPSSLMKWGYIVDPLLNFLSKWFMRPFLDSDWTAALMS